MRTRAVVDGLLRQHRLRQHVAARRGRRRRSRPAMLVERGERHRLADERRPDRRERLGAERGRALEPRRRAGRRPAPVGGGATARWAGRSVGRLRQVGRGEVGAGLARQVVGGGLGARRPSPRRGRARRRGRAGRQASPAGRGPVVLDDGLPAAAASAPRLTEPLQPASRRSAWMPPAAGTKPWVSPAAGTKPWVPAACAGASWTNSPERVGRGRRGWPSAGGASADGGAEARVAGGEAAARRARSRRGGRRCRRTAPAPERAGAIVQGAGDVGDGVVAAGEAAGGDRVAARPGSRRLVGVAKPSAPPRSPASSPRTKPSIADGEGGVAGAEGAGSRRSAVTVSGAGSTVERAGERSVMS